MDKLNFLRFLLGGLIPPDEGSPELRRFNRQVARMTVINSTGIAMIATLMWGIVPSAFPGFARADKLDAMQISQSDQQILDTRQRQCRDESDPNKNEGALRFATTRLQIQLRHYRELTNTDYRLPDCAEL